MIISRHVLTSCGAKKYVQQNVVTDVHAFNDQITIMEVRKTNRDVKNNKACGFNALPAEVLENDTSLSVLHVMFMSWFRSYVYGNRGRHRNVANDGERCRAFRNNRD